MIVLQCVRGVSPDTASPLLQTLAAQKTREKINDETPWGFLRYSLFRPFVCVLPVLLRSLGSQQTTLSASGSSAEASPSIRQCASHTPYIHNDLIQVEYRLFISGFSCGHVSLFTSRADAGCCSRSRQQQQQLRCCEW